MLRVQFFQIICPLSSESLLGPPMIIFFMGLEFNMSTTPAMGHEMHRQI